MILLIFTFLVNLGLQKRVCIHNIDFELTIYSMQTNYNNCLSSPRNTSKIYFSPLIKLHNQTHKIVGFWTTYVFATICAHRFWQFMFPFNMHKPLEIIKQWHLISNYFAIKISQAPTQTQDTILTRWQRL